MKKPIAKKETGASRHARLGPSGYKSREICPSYKNDEGSSGAAEEGDLLHGVMEALVKTALTSKKPINMAMSPEFKGLDDERQISMIEMVAGYVQPLLAAAAYDGEIEVELDLKILNLPDTDFGTADVLLYQEEARHLDVVDYKFGWLEVDDAEENIQGWLYGLGSFARRKRAQTCTVHFLQPRRDELSTGSFTRDRIPEMTLRAQVISERVLKLAGQTFNPVVENCLWCANKAQCGALHALVLRLDGKTPMRFPESVKQWDPEKITDPKQAADVYDFGDMLFKYGASLRNRVTQMAQDGWEIPGHDLKSRAGKSSIIDPKRAVEIAQEKFGVELKTLDQILTVAEPSLHGLEAAIGALQPRGEKGNSKTRFRQELAKEGILEQGRPSAWLEVVR